MQALYPDIDIQTSVTGCPTQVKLDRDDLLELAGNLMDNACKFALSTARLAVSCDTACLTLVFEDDGNGLQSRDLESIQQRGVRLDETREGQGIGLSLCKDIIESYRGNLDFSKSPLGGLRVAAEIPLTRA
jgi:signal transduction histidine kinase